jgi:hypothetical protein
MADIFSIHCPCIRHEHADKNKSGKTDDEIAGILQCSQTVFNIRRKFCENGLTVAEKTTRITTNTPETGWRNSTIVRVRRQKIHKKEYKK